MSRNSALWVTLLSRLLILQLDYLFLKINSIINNILVPFFLTTSNSSKNFNIKNNKKNKINIKNFIFKC